MLMIMNDKNEMVVVNDWKDVPEPITKIGYKISPTQCIIMQGFDSYLRIKEMVKGVNCNIGGVSKVFLFGRIAMKTAVVELDMKTGKISNHIVEKGMEYGGNLQAEGQWKKGIRGKDQKVSVEDISITQ